MIYADYVNSVSRDISRLLRSGGKEAAAIRRKMGSFFTSQPLSYFYNPVTKQACIRGQTKSNEMAICKMALSKMATVVPDAKGWDWVKVAYSPTLRRAGEVLNFFPGTYVKGIKNSPSPLASMLTTGLLGAGVGYGAARLGGSFLGDDWDKKKLNRSGAIAGAVLGATPGMLWAYANKATDRPWNDPGLLDALPDPSPKIASLIDSVKEQAQRNDFIFNNKTAGDSELYKAASILDVHINTLGQTLWESGANPRDAAVTMATVQTASQMPGKKRPGWVTPMQMGRLAAGLGVGYLNGMAAGALLGQITGLPETAKKTLRQTGAMAGVVQQFVPTFFGGN